jgi:WD40 repeat protein
MLAIGNRRGDLQLYDVERRVKVFEVSAHMRRIGVMDSTPDGKLIACGSNDTFISIRDVRTKRCAMKIKAHKYVPGSHISLPGLDHRLLILGKKCVGLNSMLSTMWSWRRVEMTTSYSSGIFAKWPCLPTIPTRAQWETSIEADCPARLTQAGRILEQATNILELVFLPILATLVLARLPGYSG